MYQFTTTSVINNNLDSSGKPKYIGDASGLHVKRVGKFKTAGIVDSTVWKNAYRAGVLETAGLTIPALTVGETLRLYVSVKLEQNAFSSYAVSNSQDFKSDINIEVISTGVAADDATALVAAYSKTVTTYEGSPKLNVSNVGALITIEASNLYQRFDVVEAQVETANGNSIASPTYVEVATGVVTPGVAAFGSDEYMLRTIKIPTLDNTRQWGVDTDGRPIIGGNYSQYTLRYSIEKDGTDGIRGGGQSITTHVFFIPAALVADWEAELTDADPDGAGLTITDARA